MSQLLAIPVMMILIGLQITLSSKFMILNGFADIVLVWLISWVVQVKIKRSWLWFIVGILSVCYISAIPWYAHLIGYLIIFLLGIFVKKRLWQSPLLSFLLTLITGSFFYYFIVFMSLKINGSPVTFGDAFPSIIMPSVILNLILAFPIYLIAKDMISWLYTKEENI